MAGSRLQEKLPELAASNKMPMLRANEGAWLHLAGHEPFHPLISREYNYVEKGRIERRTDVNLETTLSGPVQQVGKLCSKDPTDGYVQLLFKLDKKHCRTMASLLTGHIGLQNMLRQMGVTKSPACKRCGARRLLYTPNNNYKKQKKNLLGNRENTICDLLTSSILLIFVRPFVDDRNWFYNYY